MIPLGSCTMKLNATSEMIPVTWPEVGQLHPFAPESQTKGYETMLQNLSKWLSEITGFHTVSLQPNAGSQGELRASWPFGHTMSRAETSIATSASFPLRRMEPTRLPQSWLA